MSKTLKVKQLKRVLEDAPDNLPVVVVGDTQRVVSAQIVYQGKFTDMDDYELYRSEKPVAVALQLVPV